MDMAAQAIATGAAAGIGGAAGGAAGGVSGAGMGLVVDANNRQLHSEEKILAKHLAKQSNGKYTQAQIEDQMRGMSMKINGVTEAGTPDVIIGTNLGDGTWLKAGTTSDGQPIFMQQISTEDTALRTYIVNNTTHGEIPSSITYGATYIAPSYSNTAIPLPMPIANCATAECAAGVLPNRPLSQTEIDTMKSGTADFAASVSNQAGQFSAYATAYGAYLASQPNAVLQAGALTQYGMAGTATIVGFGASAIEQLLRPPLCQDSW
ncbi:MULTISPECIES: hypothetical protein [unclassified Undibacterium]|uniref:hypothetical protein n=1 Tax=unclassified Undibacterium TaxID=2630295 RepID=UPI002AC9EE4E|nr:MULTISPECIES: hypothetical protein [unclassified Undibacterium]MEB0141013.1 hypothetical protein [Undibacterium sp. CCC2.1]MEB0171156.1 hypothetical protein [Undibacterium sp. CCC1.1]MEB0175201.1 hypothetical protein [Undibacterium sp. CCC3.4]MEB0214609.1 hypothetical protein [Undibacterium sp. 5I2]WPX42377.1 hypothetical protein RHM61_13340 [Undibacterium sp. CCC3.4]